MKSTETKEFLPHQKEAFEKIVGTFQDGSYKTYNNKLLPLHGFLFHDDMGLGKTLVSAHVLNTMRKSCPSLPSLVIAKAALLNNFKKELKEVIHIVDVNSKSTNLVDLFATNPDVLLVMDLDVFLDCPDLNLNNNCVVFCPTSRLSRMMSAYAFFMTPEFFLNDPWCRSRYFLVNHREDSLDDLRFNRFRSTMVKSSAKRVPSNKILEAAKKFFNQKWGFFVADECQDFKNAGSLQTRAVSFIHSEYRLAMTATPSMNSGEEMCNIVRYVLSYDSKYPWNDNSSEFYQQICFGRKAHEVQNSLNLPALKHYDVRLSMEGHPVDIKIYKRQLLALNRAAEALDDVGLLFDGETKEQMIQRQRISQRKFFSGSDALVRCCLHHSLYVEKCFSESLEDDDNSKGGDLDNLEKKEEERLAKQKEVENIIFSTPWSPKNHMSFPFWFRARVFEVMCSLKYSSVSTSNGYIIFPKEIRQKIAYHFAEAEKKLVPFSPKLEAILCIYNEMEKKNVEGERKDKLIVMSRSLVFLKLVSRFFEERSVGVSLLTGESKNVKEKAKVISDFQNDPNKKVMCATIQVAGEGLNLQDVSSTLILCEPGWNVAKDRQAVKRIHRIGQKRETTVYRLIVSGSVDEAFLSLQKAKEEVCNSARNLKGFFKVSKTLKSGIDFNLQTALLPKEGDPLPSFVRGELLHERLTQSTIFEDFELDPNSKDYYQIYDDERGKRSSSSEEDIPSANIVEEERESEEAREYQSEDIPFADVIEEYYSVSEEIPYADAEPQQKRLRR